MANILDVIQPYFQQQIQGRQALQTQKASLDREAFDAQIQEARRKKAEAIAAKEQEFGRALDLAKVYGGADLSSLYPGVLPTGPTIQERRDVEDARRWQAEQDALAKYRGGQLSVQQQKIAEKRKDDELKQFQLDALAKGIWSNDPAAKALSQNIGETRANKAALLKDIGITQNDFSSLFNDSADSLSQVAKPSQIDSLRNLDMNLNSMLGDSTNTMNLLRFNLLNNSQFRSDNNDVTDEEIDQIFD